MWRPLKRRSVPVELFRTTFGGSVPFSRRNHEAAFVKSTRNSVILGIGGLLGHDGNAALLVDGRLIAASQEERFTRKKHDATFPRSAILDCLSMDGLRPTDVDVCVFAEKPL